MFYNFDMQIALISLKESEFCFIDEASACLFTVLDAHQYGNALRGGECTITGDCRMRSFTGHSFIINKKPCNMLWRNVIVYNWQKQKLHGQTALEHGL